MSFATWLRSVMQAHGHNVYDLGTACAVRGRTVHRWRAGERLPDPPMLETLLEVLELRGEAEAIGRAAWAAERETR